MKQQDVGDFTVLYVEPGDQRADLFQTVGIQKKPVVLILAAQVGVLQKPDDFTLLKYVKRQVDLPIIFILPHGSQQAQLAARNGFPVYQSMDMLLDALSIGQIAHMRTAHSPRPSRPLDTSNMVRKEAGPSRKEASSFPTLYSPRTTKPIFPDEHNEEEQQASNGREQIQPVEAYSPPTPTVWDSPLYTHDEQSQQKQSSNHITQQFTPIPQTFISEEDAEQQEAYSDPYRAGFPDAKDKIRHNTGNIWPSTRINISYRNTGPLASRNVGAGQMQYPMTDRGNLRENQISLPATPFVGDSNRTIPNTSNVFALGGRKSRLYILLCVLVIAAIGSLLVLPHFLKGAAPTPQIAGHLVFTSSGQVSETSSQGIEDQVTLDLTNLAVPATGKALYAWLLGDKSQSDLQTILLGKLQVNNGTAHLFYPGNPQHTNMLLTMSRVLVTEEDTVFVPVAPSPDQNTWRYYSEFSTAPIKAADNTKHFSYLDHLRHLLAADPTLEELELHGGLNNWLYNNTNKTKEWVDSTRQQWEETKDTEFVHRQLERALQFLDGDTFVYQDMPQGAPLLVNERLARLGLINITGPNQEPPDYLTHISHHLNGLLEASPTPATRQKITDLITALGNVNQWLKQVRYDAQQLMKMTDSQMMQQSTLALIDDMIANMDNAYSGQPDPSTNTVHEGVNWIHTQTQFLASLDITPFAISS